MTNETHNIIIEIFVNNFEELRVSEFVPNIATRGKTSTGNLAFNGLQYLEMGEDFKGFIDEEIAPYAIYTNEPWSKGVNPNQGWWNRFCEELVERFDTDLKDTFSQ